MGSLGSQFGGGIACKPIFSLVVCWAFVSFFPLRDLGPFGGTPWEKANYPFPQGFHLCPGFSPFPLVVTFPFTFPQGFLGTFPKRKGFYPLFEPSFNFFPLVGFWDPFKGVFPLNWVRVPPNRVGNCDTRVHQLRFGKAPLDISSLGSYTGFPFFATLFFRGAHYFFVADQCVLTSPITGAVKPEGGASLTRENHGVVSHRKPLIGVWGDNSGGFPRGGVFPTKKGEKLSLGGAKYMVWSTTPTVVGGAHTTLYFLGGTPQSIGRGGCPHV